MNDNAVRGKMEVQCVGKPFWHPKASRLEAEKLLRHKPPGSFVIRRSSKTGCLALSHKLPNHSYGHALILFDGSGYMLEQADHTYARIESLVKSLDLRLETEKEKPPRPTHVLDGKLVLFQAEVLCTYNHVVEGELDAARGDYLNVYGMEGPHYLCELKGKGGLFPIGLSKKVAGSEAGVPQHLLQKEEAKAFKPGESALPASSNYMSTTHAARMPPNYASAGAGRSFPSLPMPSDRPRSGEMLFGAVNSAPPTTPGYSTRPPGAGAQLQRRPSVVALNGARTVGASPQRSNTAPNSPMVGGGGPRGTPKSLPSTPLQRSPNGSLDANRSSMSPRSNSSSGANLYSTNPNAPPGRTTTSPLTRSSPQPSAQPSPRPVSVVVKPLAAPAQPTPLPQTPAIQQQQQPIAAQPQPAAPEPVAPVQPQPTPVAMATPVAAQPQQPHNGVAQTPSLQPTMPTSSGGAVLKPIDDPMSPQFIEPRKRCQVCNAAKAVAKVTMASGTLVKMCQDCIQKERQKKAEAKRKQLEQQQQQQQQPTPLSQANPLPQPTPLPQQPTPLPQPTIQQHSQQPAFQPQQQTPPPQLAVPAAVDTPPVPAALPQPSPPATTNLGDDEPPPAFQHQYEPQPQQPQQPQPPQQPQQHQPFDDDAPPPPPAELEPDPPAPPMGTNDDEFGAAPPAFTEQPPPDPLGDDFF